MEINIIFTNETEYDVRPSISIRGCMIKDVCHFEDLVCVSLNGKGEYKIQEQSQDVTAYIDGRTMNINIIKPFEKIKIDFDDTGYPIKYGVKIYTQ